MPLEFKLTCWGEKQKIIIHEDGSLEMPGYDPDYEKSLVEFGEDPKKLSLCFYLFNNWGTLTKGMADIGIDFSKELSEERVEYDRRDPWKSWRREFNFSDLACLLTKVLKEYVEKEDEDAIDIASVLGKLPLDFDEEPGIDASKGFEEGEMYDGVFKHTTHTLKVCEEEIASWEHTVERRVYDIFTFESEVENRDEDLDKGPSEFIQRVLEAMGLEDLEPDPPEEFYIPAKDESGEGAYGVMYEELVFDYEHGWPPKEIDVKSVQVIVYDNDREAMEAAWLANKIQDNTGDHSYRITPVRRKGRKERHQDQVDAAHRAYLRKQYRIFESGVEDPEEFDPIYDEWTELEKDRKDRPDDFED